jgi:hypothetical protein
MRLPNAGIDESEEGESVVVDVVVDVVGIDVPVVSEDINAGVE